MSSPGPLFRFAESPAIDDTLGDVSLGMFPSPKGTGAPAHPLEPEVIIASLPQPMDVAPAAQHPISSITDQTSSKKMGVSASQGSLSPAQPLKGSTKSASRKDDASASGGKVRGSVGASVEKKSSSKSNKKKSSKKSRSKEKTVVSATPSETSQASVVVVSRSSSQVDPSPSDLQPSGPSQSLASPSTVDTSDKAGGGGALPCLLHLGILDSL